MDIFEQVLQVVKRVDAEDDLDMLLANDAYQREQQERFTRLALTRHPNKTWQSVEARPIVMTDPAPGIDAVEFWVVVLVDWTRREVREEIFYEVKEEGD